MAAHCPWLPEVLAHCVRAIPRYKGLQPELAAFPLVRKQEIVAAIRDFVSLDAGSLREGLACYLTDPHRKREPGGSCETKWSESIVVEETSGTTGIPFNFPKTAHERSRIGLAIWQYRKRLDHLVSARNFYPLAHAPIGFVHKRDPYDFSVENVRAICDSFALCGIRWLHGSPSTLLKYARCMEGQSSATSQLRYVETSGARLAPSVRSEIETGLKVKTINQYGCREVWAMGFSRGTDEFDVLRDNVLIELLDGNGEAIETPGIRGTVVVTARHQRLLPFVRYWTGDVALWLDGEVGSRLLLCESDVCARDASFEDGMTGEEYFRMMLIRAFRITGFMVIKRIQIRQVAPDVFILAMEKTAGAERLREALELLCNAKRASSWRFSLQLLDPGDVETITESSGLFARARGFNKS